jgi:iron complex outermembrane receptor protein
MFSPRVLTVGPPVGSDAAARCPAAAITISRFLLPALCAVSALGQTPGSTAASLGSASLEDLMNVQVTSVSRKEESLSKAGAAVFVISQEDIRRSGAANIPDVLRMAPGVNVAQIDANIWAISIRGFNSRYSDKILVLIDERSVHSPGYSGVNWDEIDVPLEDIERIEVIRGPGGTVWGANAVDGVINIITMNSKATQGSLVAATSGSRESGGLVQYGGAAGGLGTWRAFGKYSNTDSSINPDGGAAADGWHTTHGGFRADLELSPQDTVMVQGNLYGSREGQTLTTVLSNELPVVATLNDPVTVGTGDIQTRWNHTLENGSETSLNVYYDHINRLDLGLTENANTFNVDFQHHIAINGRNDVVWGLGYRVTGDRLTPGYAIQFSPPQRTDSLYSAFVQDEIKLAESVRITIGTKFEHNAFTGFQVNPSAQFVWTPTSHQTVWLSAAQANQQPSPQNTDIRFDAAIVPLGGSNFGLVQYRGSSQVQDERLRDYEVGYRSQVSKGLSLDIAAFRSYYRSMESANPGTPFLTDTQGTPYIVFPEYINSGGSARTYGGEVFAAWNATSRWRLSSGYSLLRMSASNMAQVQGYTPEQQIQFRSALGLRSNLDWDTSVYFVGHLSGGQIPAYTRLDMQLRWRIHKSVEIGVTGQNLLSPIHAEFGNTFDIDHTQVVRSVFGKITWRF